jgi:M6 family metalloprotease-like protein
MTGKTRLALIFILLALATLLNSAYLTRMPLKLQQPDGKPISLYATGDEYYNWLHDENGYTIKQDSDGWYKYVTFINNNLVYTPLIALQDNPAASGIAPWQNISAERMGEVRREKQLLMRTEDQGRAPTSGTLNNIVIFIRFSDQTEFGETIANYDSKFNGTTGNTMQSYFQEASYGALNIPSTFYPTPTSMVVSWQDSNPRAYYSPYNATTNPIGYSGDTERTNREHTLLVNAVIGVRSQIPTSLNLDGDNDGRVDNVVFIIKGASDGWAELLWPHRWSLYTQYVYINSKRVYDFNFQLSEFTNSSGNGVLCHEMYHSLGAPDLYHYTSDGISPVGPWDLMENNANPPQHMGAYMKWKYGGWISSIPVINTPGTYTLNPLSSSTNNAYRINSPYSSSQYYVVEFRKKTGTFENSLPGSGLLVYRIDTSAGNGNASGPPDEVYVYRPNGTTTVNGTVSSANYSLETARTMINPYTNPAPFLQDGSNGGLYLHSIGSSAGTTISFTYSNIDPTLTLNEGFENGILTPPWTFSGNANWTVDTTTFYSGVKSAKSGTITHNQTSSMQMTQNIEIPGQVTFFHKVSSEANYDYLKFYIDGVLQGQWSGTTAWAMAAYDVAVGNRTFKWEYMKDGSVNTGSDCAWVDHIGWPVPVYNPPLNLTGLAGNQQIVLNWSAPESGTPSSYKVFRNSSYLATTTNPTYTDNGLTNGITYSYYVTAVYTSPNGESDPSNTVAVTPGLTVTLGSGTATTGTSEGCPINIWYKSLHGQSVYTAAELTAAGINGPVTITQIGFYINSVPDLALPAFLVRMKHTSDTNVANWQTSAGMTTVYTNASYMPTAGGFEMLNLSTPFVWNGTDNIVIDTAFGLVSTYSSTGTVQYSSVSNGYRYVRSDSVDETDVFTGGSVTSYRPNVRLAYFSQFSGPEIVVAPEELSFGTRMINTMTVQNFTIQNTGDLPLTGSITTPSGYSVALAVRANQKPSNADLSKQTATDSSRKNDSLTSVQSSPQRNTLAYSVPEGSSSTFNVTFAPTAVQAYNGNITITHNADGPSKTIALTGQGGKPTIGLSATTFTTNLAPGQTNNQTLTVSNSGNLALNYTLTITGSPSWLTINTTDTVSSSIVAGGPAQNILVRFNAAGIAPGTYSATIVCTSNDPALPSQNITANLTVRTPIAITAPAAGANWPGGSLRNIVFGYSGAGTSVHMYYSFDDGLSWNDGGVINAIYGSNTYGWIVPNHASANCRIKLVDSIAPYAEKISNLFTISAPSVPLLTVTSPNGGENWVIDSTYNITWTHNLLHPEVMLYYSLDNGSSWIYIATVAASAQSYAWNTPSTTSTQCLIRIVDALDSYALDVSNSTFSLVNPAPPSVPVNVEVSYSQSTGTATISWTPSSGNPTGYNIFMATHPDFSDEVLLGYVPIQQTSFTDPLAGTRPHAFYRIVAVRN